MDRVQPKKAAHRDLETLQQQLQIDPDDLESALIEQPDLYYHVSDSYVNAVARRDAVKFSIEQVTAELGEQMRKAAVAKDEKLTEAAITRKLADTPRLQEMEEQYLALRLEADRWQALKEAFQQRSFMLRELVAIFVRRMGDLSIERDSRGAHQDLIGARADANHAAASKARLERKAAR